MQSGQSAALSFDLVARAKAIILSPRSEWLAIREAPASVAVLYRNYAMILAAIPALAGFFRAVVFGHGFLFRYRSGILSALSTALLQYMLSLVALAVIALIANMVVTRFEGRAHRGNAFNLAAFSLTASWLAGAFELIPGLGLLSLLGLYSFYLLYTGLPVLMEVPREKALVCTLVIALSSAVVLMVASAIVSPLAVLVSGRSASYEPTANLPGIGKDRVTGNLEQRLHHMEDAARKASVTPIAADQLKAYMPEHLGGYERVEIASTSMGQAGGVRGSSVNAVYALGDDRVKVELVDMAALGAVAGMGAALGIESERETADGFSRTFSEGGRMVTEKWNKSSRHGTYSTTFGDRFMISIEGEADDYATISDMIGDIDLSGIAGLAR
ncbi:Yip1 family protein [Novosphingobium naphthalenivorans]|uniref:Yip1 family protein n=1 Tax=Novosphingobium naphthalenivorans TaxID=273168 RepID=UPI000A4B3199|nr:Yip1 family protein [Novosphingobium naphthalenivorans]